MKLYLLRILCLLLICILTLQACGKKDKLPKSIDGVKMVLIPAGDFQMGSNDSYAEKPVHTVYLDAFYMDVYEVTNAQYKKFIMATEHSTSSKYFNNREFHEYNDPKQPVVGISWNDAIAYANWSGKRLSTEAEWEKAARGGLVGKKYVWGDEWPPPEKAGNFSDEALKRELLKYVKQMPMLLQASESLINDYDDGYAYTAPVGNFAPNGYGLYDMAGNVMEWCSDWYDDDYYTNSPKSNPKGPSSGEYGMLRGGSHGVNDLLLVTSRYPCTHSQRTTAVVGFRCAMDVPK